MKLSEAYVLLSGMAERDLFFNRSTVGHHTIKSTDGKWFTMVDTTDGDYVCSDCLIPTVDRMTESADAESDDYAASDADYGTINGLPDVFIFGTDDPYGYLSIAPMSDDRYDDVIVCVTCDAPLTDDLPAEWLSKCFDAYLDCLVWQAKVILPDGSSVPLDDTHVVDDIEASDRDDLMDDVKGFVLANWSDVRDLDPESVGHDFCLSRNGHGAGFFDHGTEARWTRLQDAARVYGTSDLDVLSDGSLYVTN